jgi:hypothetical protein
MQVGQEAPKQVIDYKFCKRCGSTVYWDIPLPAGAFGPTEVVVTGIAVSCFFEADFPRPTEDHFVSDRHHWIESTDGAVAYERLPPAGDVREPS